MGISQSYPYSSESDEERASAIAVAFEAGGRAAVRVGRGPLIRGARRRNDRRFGSPRKGIR